jgi:hypothetical protein
MHQLINDLSNAETGLRALGDMKSLELADRIHEYLPGVIREGGVVLTPAGRRQFLSAAVQRTLDSSARNRKKTSQD